MQRTGTTTDDLTLCCGVAVKTVERGRGGHIAMSRVEYVEYWNDPDAPKPNSLIPAAGVLAVDDQGRLHDSSGDLFNVPPSQDMPGDSVRLMSACPSGPLSQ
jgi:hypothetical protein